MLDYIRAYMNSQTIMVAAVLFAVGIIVLPKLTFVSTLLGKIPWPFKRSAAVTGEPSEVDNRKQLHDALCQLSDRASLTECPQLRAEQDSAVTTLSKMVTRMPDYQPTSTPQTT